MMFYKLFTFDLHFNKVNKVLISGDYYCATKVEKIGNKVL